MGAISSSIADDFSLVIGAPFYRLLIRLGLVRREAPNIVRRIFVLVLLTWVPLLILSLLQGVAYGGHIVMPFLSDFSAYARFLIALPLLIVAEVVIDPRLKRVVKHFVSSDLLHDEEVPAFDSVIQGVTRLRDSALAEAVIFLLAFMPIFLALESATWSGRGVSTWHLIGSGPEAHLSMAALWYIFMATAIFRFILYRWVWRLIVWSILLHRVSRLNLKLVATHPDRAAGLGFVTAGQIRFGILLFAGGTVIAATMGNAVRYEGVSIRSLYVPMIAYVVLALVLLLGPLLLLTPRLREVRIEGLLQYAALANQYVQSFDMKWVQRKQADKEPLLGSEDIEALADTANSFDVIREMRMVPIFKTTVLLAVAQAGAPFVPLLVLATPLNEIMGTLLKFLLM
jgi:hypothetical protein